MIPLTEAQKNFAEKHHNLIYSFLKKYNLSEDEWYDVAAIGFIKAVSCFDMKRAVFSTFAYACMLSDVQKEMRYQKAVKRCAFVLSLNDVMPGTADIELGDAIDDNNDYMEEMLLKSTILSMATERQKQIVRLLYCGFTQVEVAKQLGTSKQYVSKEIRKLKRLALRMLRD